MGRACEGYAVGAISHRVVLGRVHETGRTIVVVRPSEGCVTGTPTNP